MNGWTEITGENRRFERYRVDVGEKGGKNILNMCSFLHSEAYDLNSSAEKCSFD